MNANSNPPPARPLLVAGALLLAIGIGIGALGSHALQNVLTAAQLHALDTAVHYQQFNALGLMLVGLLIHLEVGAGDPWLRRAGWMLGIGILCFSGGIYIMLAGAPRLLGLVTPVGGVLLILAWCTLAWRLSKMSVITRR